MTFGDKEEFFQKMTILERKMLEDISFIGVLQ